MISCAKLAQLGVVLPDPPAPRGDYAPDLVHHGVVYVSGQLLREGNLTITGPVTSATLQDDLKRAGRGCFAHGARSIKPLGWKMWRHRGRLTRHGFSAL